MARFPPSLDDLINSIGLFKTKQNKTKLLIGDDDDDALKVDLSLAS